MALRFVIKRSCNFINEDTREVGIRVVSYVSCRESIKTTHTPSTGPAYSFPRLKADVLSCNIIQSLELLGCSERAQMSAVRARGWLLISRAPDAERLAPEAGCFPVWNISAA